MREEKLLEQIEAALQTLHLTPDALAKIEEDFYQEENAQLKHFNKSFNDLTNQKHEMDRKLSVLSDMLLDKLLSKPEYKRKRAEYLLKASEINSQIEKVKGEKDKFRNSILEDIQDAATALTRFKVGNNAEKRMILEQFFEELELKGEQLQCVIKYPYNGFVKNHKK